MKVIMKPYPNWVGSYQIAEKLFFFFDEDKQERIGDLIAKINGKTKFLKIFDYIYKCADKKRVSVRVDDYDIWSADFTLAQIIVPVLKKLQEQKHGSPHVDNEDVPEHLRTPEGFNLYNGDNDDHFHDRWDYVLDEMIWAFEHAIIDDAQYYVIKPDGTQGEFDRKAQELDDERALKGRMLFAKYFNALWD